MLVSAEVHFQVKDENQRCISKKKTIVMSTTDHIPLMGQAQG
jgi:hypothetical protein